MPLDDDDKVQFADIQEILGELKNVAYLLEKGFAMVTKAILVQRNDDDYSIDYFRRMEKMIRIELFGEEEETSDAHTKSL